MNLPETQRAIEAELDARRAAGLCDKVATFTSTLMRDPMRGVFVRFKFTLTSGETFTVDSIEPEFNAMCERMNRAATTH